MRRAGIPVRKSWGQHFIKNEATAAKIAALVPAAPGELVLEIGPGHGALTRPLQRRGFPLLLVERDPLLAKRWANQPGLELVVADILKSGGELLRQHGPLHVTGSLPYNISTPILFLLWEHAALVKSAVILLQKEVGERLLAKPGDKVYGSFSVCGQSVCAWERCLPLPPHEFVPPPKVQSLVLRATPRAGGISPGAFARLKSITRVVFQQRRKKLINTLPAALGGDKDRALQMLAAAGLTPDVRPERVPVETYIAWAETLVRQ